MGAALSFVSYPGTLDRLITERRLFGYCCFQLLIVFLHYVERLFLLSPVGDQSLSFVKVLDARQRPAWGAEIHQDPGTRAAQERDSSQHTHLVLVEVLLVFFGPSRQGITMISVRRFSAKFTHNQRFLVLRFPFHSISLFRQTIVPAYILIAAEHVEVFSKRIIDHLRLLFDIDIVTFHRRRYQSSGVEA